MSTELPIVGQDVVDPGQPCCQPSVLDEPGCC